MEKAAVQPIPYINLLESRSDKLTRSLSDKLSILTLSIRQAVSLSDLDSSKLMYGIGPAPIGNVVRPTDCSEGAADEVGF